MVNIRRFERVLGEFFPLDEIGILGLGLRSFLIDFGFHCARFHFLGLRCGAGVIYAFTLR
jgi:hypothetical protein